MRNALTAAAAAGLALALAGGAALAQEGGRPLSVALTGAAEKPGPGDPDGSGKAELRLNPGQNQVCYELAVSKIGTPVAAHIHRGAATESGPPVVDLKAPAGGMSSGCATPKAGTTVKAIMDNLGGYYVNVHSQDIPAGAVRGQLASPAKGPKTP